MARKLIIALGVAAITFTVTACNTVTGWGRETEASGDGGYRPPCAPATPSRLC